MRWEIVACAWDKEGLDFAERTLIAQHGTLSPNGYNLKTGGANGKPCDETKAKLSAKASRQWNSPEYRRKHAAAMSSPAVLKKNEKGRERAQRRPRIPSEARSRNWRGECPPRSQGKQVSRLQKGGANAQRAKAAEQCRQSAMGESRAPRSRCRRRQRTAPPKTARQNGRNAHLAISSPVAQSKSSRVSSTHQTSTFARSPPIKARRAALINSSVVCSDRRQIKTQSGSRPVSPA